MHPPCTVCVCFRAHHASDPCIATQPNRSARLPANTTFPPSPCPAHHAAYRTAQRPCVSAQPTGVARRICGLPCSLSDGVSALHTGDASVFSGLRNQSLYVGDFTFTLVVRWDCSWRWRITSKNQLPERVREEGREPLVTGPEPSCLTALTARRTGQLTRPAGEPVQPAAFFSGAAQWNLYMRTNQRGYHSAYCALQTTHTGISVKGVSVMYLHCIFYVCRLCRVNW